MILQKIIDAKKVQLKEEMRHVGIEDWKQRLSRPGIHKTIDLYKAIKREGRVSIISEVKKASPSKGIIKEDFEPLKIAKEYYASDVQALSVLTEKNFFQGADEYLVDIRQSIPLPILRKDFTIDLWQIYQARFLGADAILLIVSVLSDDELKRFQDVAEIGRAHV